MAAEEVVIVVHAENDTEDDCLDSRTVELAGPLADRRVVDGVTGEALTIQPSDGSAPD